MSKKQDMFYYDNFVECAEIAAEAADLLKETLMNFKPEQLQAQLDKIHEIEHRGDDAKHKMTDKLAKAFITPIEREDILDLSHSIDEITDKIEDVLIRIYINNVQVIRKDAMDMLKVVQTCCGEVCTLLKEFPDFRRSKTMRDRIIHINALEEEADRLFVSSMRALHEDSGNFMEVIAWREVYTYLEKCADACEHTADVVENVIMKNS